MSDFLHSLDPERTRAASWLPIANKVPTAEVDRLSPQCLERVAVAAASRGSGAMVPETNHARAQTGYTAD
jgi:hypothetical protein